METSIYDRRTRVSDLVLKGLIYLCTAVSVLVLAGIIGYVAAKGIPALSIPFLTGVESVKNGTYGILPNLINTLYIVVITLAVATPIGVGSAIYLNEYAARGRLVRLIEFTTETLAGIPSIIFGLFGYVFFRQALGLGYSILSGAFTLTLMVLPIITRTTQEALKTVPESYRSGALGIGATKWYMIRTIILPSALPGIVTGVILAVGRIVGESAALLFTAGSLAKLPQNFLTHPASSGGTLTIQMYLEMSKARYDRAFGIAVVLLAVVLVINIATKLVSRKLDVSRKG